MSNVVELVSFKLKKGESVPDFLLASDKLNKEFLSMQRGYISRKLLIDGETWSDLVIWETMNDAQNAAKAMLESAVAGGFMSFMDKESCKFLHLSVERSY